MRDFAVLNRLIEQTRISATQFDRNLVRTLALTPNQDRHLGEDCTKIISLFGGTKLDALKRIVRSENSLRKTSPWAHRAERLRAARVGLCAELRAHSSNKVAAE